VTFRDLRSGDPPDRLQVLGERMIGALVRHYSHGRGVIIDAEEDEGETEYLIFLDNPIVWGPDEIYRTYWVRNKSSFEVLSES